MLGAQQRNAPLTLTPEQVAAEQAAFMRKVYAFMASGLGATALTAMIVVQSDPLLRTILSPPVFWGLLIGELLMVWTFSWLAQRTSAIGAAALFFIYAVMN